MDNQLISISKPLFVSLLTTLIGLSFLMTNPGSFALAAGSSSQSVTKPDSSYDKRDKANKYFKKGEYYQSRNQFGKAAKQYQKTVKIDSGYADLDVRQRECLIGWRSRQPKCPDPRASGRSTPWLPCRSVPGPRV